MKKETHAPVVNTDDLGVLRDLLHSIHGLSLVSTTEYSTVPIDEE